MDESYTHRGTPSPYFGTEGYLHEHTIQRTLHDSLQESRQQQKASDLADDPQAAAVVSPLGVLSPEEIALVLAHRRQTASQAIPEPVPEVTTTSLDENHPQQAPDDPPAPPESVLSAEALVALVERKRGTLYDAQARQCQLVAARTLLDLNLPLDLSLIERLYETCNDDWWQAHYGDLHLTHLVEREKHGQPRITRLLARLQARNGSATRQATTASASEQESGRHPAIGVSGRPLFHLSGQPLKVLPPERSPRRRSIVAGLGV